MSFDTVGMETLVKVCDVCQRDLTSAALVDKMKRDRYNRWKCIFRIKFHHGRAPEVRLDRPSYFVRVMMYRNYIVVGCRSCLDLLERNMLSANAWSDVLERISGSNPQNMSESNTLPIE